jgi:glutamate racemase
VDPGAKAAVAASQGRIGIIGTEGTIQSGAYTKAIQRLDPHLTVLSQPCSLFVPLVEEGWVDNEVALKVAEYYLADLRRNRIDTLVLGCTHYPLLKATIRKVMGEEVRIIDSSEAVLEEIVSILDERGLRRTEGRGQSHLYVTDLPQRFERVGGFFLGENLPPVCQVDLIST